MSKDEILEMPKNDKIWIEEFIETRDNDFFAQAIEKRKELDRSLHCSE